MTRERNFECHPWTSGEKGKKSNRESVANDLTQPCYVAKLALKSQRMGFKEILGCAHVRGLGRMAWWKMTWMLYALFPHLAL